MNSTELGIFSWPVNPEHDAKAYLSMNFSELGSVKGHVKPQFLKACLPIFVNVLGNVNVPVKPVP